MYFGLGDSMTVLRFSFFIIFVFFLNLLAPASILAAVEGELSYEDIYSHVHPSFLKADHEDLKEDLKDKVLTPLAWQQKMNESSWDMLCVGETHSEGYRNTISSLVLSELRFEHLLLESKAGEIEPLLQGYHKTESAFLLSAPLTNIFQSALRNNPQLRISGVERRPEQQRLALDESLHLKRGKLTREAFIAQNIVDTYRPGEKTLALYGSLHCARLNKGLGLDTPFFKLMESYFRSQEMKVSNVRVIHAKDHRVLSALLRQYGYLKRQPIVLSNLQDLKPSAYNHQVDLYILFKDYDNLVVVP